MIKKSFHAGHRQVGLWTNSTIDLNTDGDVKKNVKVTLYNIFFTLYLIFVLFKTMCEGHER